MKLLRLWTNPHVTLAAMSVARLHESASDRRASRRTVVAACIGNAVEWYDFAVFGALATVVGAVFFPSKDVTTALTAAFAVYGTALIVRPLGALAFGRLGDVRGRRPLLVVAVVLMTGATVGLGLLPGYAVIGIMAPILLMVLRATQGLAAGGELGVASVMILESAHGSHRGQAAALQTSTMALGIGSGMAVVAGLAHVFDGSPHIGWWRIAFLLALPLGLVGLRVRRQLVETLSFTRILAGVEVVDDPVRAVWKDHRRAVLRGFCVVAAGSSAFNVFFVFMPNNLVTRRGVGLSSALLVTAAALAVFAVAAWTIGRASDRIGRRPVAIGSGVAVVVLATPAAALIDRGGLVDLAVAQVLIGVAVAGLLSVAMLGEAFPASVRSTGVALTAGIATALIGGTAPWIAQILVLRGVQIGPGVYVTLIAAAAVLALRRWPETAFRAFD